MELTSSLFSTITDAYLDKVSFSKDTQNRSKELIPVLLGEALNWIKQEQEDVELNFLRNIGFTGGDSMCHLRADWAYKSSKNIISKYPEIVFIVHLLNGGAYSKQREPGQLILGLEPPTKFKIEAIEDYVRRWLKSTSKKSIESYAKCIYGALLSILNFQMLTDYFEQRTFLWHSVLYGCQVPTLSFYESYEILFQVPAQNIIILFYDYRKSDRDNENQKICDLNRAHLFSFKESQAPKEQRKSDSEHFLLFEVYGTEGLEQAKPCFKDLNNFKESVMQVAAYHKQFNDESLNQTNLKEAGEKQRDHRDKAQSNNIGVVNILQKSGEIGVKSEDKIVFNVFHVLAINQDEFKEMMRWLELSDDADGNNRRLNDEKTEDISKDRQCN